MRRPTRDEWAMSVALVTARRSTCVRRNVGCAMLNDKGHVLATGYNGVASGLPHCNEEVWDGTRAELPHKCSGGDSPSGTNLDACQAIHAEQNAMLQCRDVYAIHTCYVTCSPCVTCVKLLLNTGCQRIVFVEEYPHNEARGIWERAGRKWEKLVC